MRGSGPVRPVRSSVGQRIELRRMQFGLSRRVVANLVGRSEEWLRLVEVGRLRLDSVEVITQLAEVLQIDDFRELIDRPPRRMRVGAEGTGPVLRALRDEILNHPAAATVSADRDGHAILAEGTRELERCEGVWAGSERRYSDPARRLPRVLASLRAEYWRCSDPAVRDVLIRAYHLCCELLTSVGSYDLAWVVADRAMNLADSRGHDAVVAVSAWQLSNTMLYLGNPSGSRDYAIAAATRFTAAADDQAATLRGALHLLAARATAAVPNPEESERLLASVAPEAQRPGRPLRVHGIGFGAAEVALTRMEIALARRDFDQVIDVAAGFDVAEDHPAGRQSRYHVVVAAAFAGRNDHMGAAYALGKAAEASAEDLRFDPDAHQTLRQLLRQDNRLLRRDVTRLAAIAELDGRATRTA